MALFLAEADWIEITSLFTTPDVMEIDLAGIAGGIPAGATSVIIMFRKSQGALAESHALIKHPATVQSGHRFSWFYGNISHAFYPMYKQMVGPIHDGTKITARMTNDGLHLAYIVGWFESQDIGFFDNTYDLEDVVVGGPTNNSFMTLDLSGLVPDGETPAAFVARCGARSTTNSTSNTLQYRPAGATVAAGVAPGVISYDLILPVNDTYRAEVLMSDVDVQSMSIVGYCGSRFKLMSDDLDDAYDTYLTGSGGFTKHTTSYGQEGTVGAPAVPTSVAAGGAYSIRATGDSAAVTQYDPNKMKTFFVPLDADGAFESQSRYNGAGNINIHCWGVWTASQSTSVSITNVNSNNTITPGQEIAIRGEALENCTAKITGKAGVDDIDLVITSSSFDVLTCEAIDIVLTGYMFEDAVVEVEDTDLGESDQIAIEITPSTDGVLITLDSVDGTLIDKDLAAVIGDQIVIPAAIGGTQTTGFSDGDVHYDPALPDVDYSGTEHVRYWFSTATNEWFEDYVLVRQKEDPGTEPPEPPEGDPAGWRGSFALPRAMLGVPYTQDLSAYATGDSPLFYREVLGELAQFGGSVDNSTGLLTVDPTLIGTPNCRFEVYNEWGSELSNIMPLQIAAIAIYNPVSQNVEIESAEIAVSTPQEAGVSKYYMYWVADQAEAMPTRNQIKSGQNANGTVAAQSGNVEITNIGQIEWQEMKDALMSNTEYHYWFVQDVK